MEIKVFAIKGYPDQFLGCARTNLGANRLINKAEKMKALGVSLHGEHKVGKISGEFSFADARELFAENPQD